MACVSINNITINDKCDYSNGGIRRLWIAQQDNLLYKSEMLDGSDTLSNFMLFGCAEWHWKANTANYTSELSSTDSTIGSQVFTTTISLQFTKSEQNKRKAIQDALSAGDCVVVIEDMYGTKLLVEHVYLSDVTAQSGQQLSDLNGYQLTIKGDWINLPQFVHKDETGNITFDQMVTMQSKPTTKHIIEYDTTVYGGGEPEQGAFFYDLDRMNLESYQYDPSIYDYYYVFDFYLTQFKNKDIELYFIRENGDKNAPLSNVVTFNTKNYDISKFGEIANLVFTFPFDNEGTNYQLCYKVDGNVNVMMTVENAWYQDWVDALYTKIEIPVVSLERQGAVLGLGIFCSNDSNALSTGAEIYSEIKLQYYD